MSLGVRAILFVSLFLLLFHAVEARSDLGQMSRSGAMIQSSERAQSFGQLMIVFIRDLLEDEPKAIDESLIRDDE